jgi:pimeloyl-ACP methyl ester carboxylesterase
VARELIEWVHRNLQETTMFVHRPDARLFSLSFGQGPATLLALGGWVGSGEVWFEVFGHLPDWRCVAYDHRGSGASTHSGAPITVAAQVDDLIAVMDAQGVQRCVLGAESAGAGIALEAALRAPHRFDGLVLVGAGWSRPSAGAMDSFIARLEADYDTELQAFVDRCLPEPGSEDHRRWGLHVLRRAPLRHALELIRCRDQLTAQDHLRDIAQPTLVLHGELDCISPLESARSLAAALPDAELHLLPGLGHVPIFTAAARVAGLIRQRFRAHADVADGHRFLGAASSGSGISRSTTRRSRSESSVASPRP